MITILASDYKDSLVPKKCLHTHFDGTSYFYAETQEDVKAIKAMIPDISVIEEPQTGTALQALMAATPEELEQIKSFLGIN